MTKKKSKVVGVYMSAKLQKEIGKRADCMNISISHYMRLVIKKHVDSGETIKLEG